MRVMILGGYGAFGSRLARLLSEDVGIDLLIVGRSAEKARRLSEKVGGKSALVDRDGDLSAALATHQPDVLVDASGPFQTYGERPYRVVEACIAAGVHYLDLADGTDFVHRISALDAKAKAGNVVALSGLSTLPSLSFAAARHLAEGLDTVERLETGVAPSPKAPLGLSVVSATTTYAGKPIRRLQDGLESHGVGLVEARWWEIAPPGVRPLGRRMFLLADAPDLRLAAEAWPGLKSVWTGAGPAPQAPLHLLRILAWLRSKGMAPRLEPLASLFHRVINSLRWGPHRGGMVVEVSGRKAGRRVTRRWMLIAEGDDGPFIPAMAAAAVLRRMAAGQGPAPGARAATQELELADFEPLFAARAIATGVVEL
jgi:hypothetical protein